MNRESLIRRWLLLLVVVASVAVSYALGFTAGGEPYERLLRDGCSTDMECEALYGGEENVSEFCERGEQVRVDDPACERRQP